MIYFSTILTIVMFILVGINISKETQNRTEKYYNYILGVMTILSFWIGKHFVFFKIFDFEINCSIALSSFFFGILVGRLNLNKQPKQIV